MTGETGSFLPPRSVPSLQKLSKFSSQIGFDFLQWFPKRGNLHETIRRNAVEPQASNGSRLVQHYGTSSLHGHPTKGTTHSSASDRRKAFPEGHLPSRFFQ